LLDSAGVQAAFPELTNVVQIPGGAQKAVFSAMHQTDGEVVIKVFQPGTDAETVSREILAVQNINSARIPRIFETGTVPTPAGDCAWVREQRISGESLHSRLQRAGPLSKDEVLKLAHQLAATLRDAEAAKIVHRDIKPENIMVDSTGDFWLVDFGIARHLTMRSLTADARIFGKFTPGYAPPEQARNVKGQIDSRADMFAFALTLIEAATGVHPFWDGAKDAMEALTRSETQPIPRQLLPVKSAESLADLLDTMTKKRRDQRCRNMQEVLDWIEDIVTEEQKP